MARWTVDLGGVAPAADQDAVAAVGADLLRRLGEPHRRYHTSRHLSEMFAALDELEAGGAVDRREAALARVAAWFHDAVYDPAAAPGANEADSAGLAVQRLRELGAAEPDVETVRRLVLATERHEVPGAPGLGAAFHDADLWILSADVERFDGYCAEVRAEYAAVPDDAYAAGRTAVLRPFLARDTVYATAHAQRTWDERARLNLARELSRLRR
jgi:predicted metal-dependent HD superfamily phosphohydrolase